MSAPTASRVARAYNGHLLKFMNFYLHIQSDWRCLIDYSTM